MTTPRLALRVLLGAFAVGALGLVVFALSTGGRDGRIDYRVIADGLDEGDEPITRILGTDEAVAAFETSVSEELAAIDLSTEMIVVFDLQESGSCRFGPLEGVELDEVTGAITPQVSVGGGPVCTADANPHRIIVAIEWDELPDDALVFEF